MATFSALLARCAENSLVTSEFPALRPVTRSFDVFFDLRPNKRLSKQSRGWLFETPSCSLWRHCNVSALVYCRNFNRPMGSTGCRNTCNGLHRWNSHRIAYWLMWGIIWPVDIPWQTVKYTSRINRIYYIGCVVPWVQPQMSHTIYTYIFIYGLLCLVLFELRHCDWWLHVIYYHQTSSMWRIK